MTHWSHRLRGFQAERSLAQVHCNWRPRFRLVGARRGETTMVASVQQRYPIRYWLTLGYLTGLPNFVHFDPTGLTHKQGLFNPSSLIDIGWTSITAVALIILTVLSREGFFLRKFKFHGGIWIALLLGLALSTLLEPDPKFFAAKATDSLVSLYRLGQWALCFLLIVGLYSRETEERAPAMLTQFMVRMCWGALIPIWIMVPLAPSLAYISEDGVSGGIPRLGGIALHPSMVALLASIIFLHGFIMLRGTKRIASCAFASITLALTYTRSTQIVFLVVFWVYLLFFARRSSLRWIGVCGLFLVLAGGVVFHSEVESYLSRGQRASDVSAGSDRTIVWQVGMKAWAERPIVGYGYISGPKNALRDNWKMTHWLPPHAHNEFVQALMSGGLLSGGLIVWFYLYITWKGLWRARYDDTSTLFFLFWLELLLISIASTNITTGFGKPGVMFIGCFLVLVVEGRQKATVIAFPRSVPGSFLSTSPNQQQAVLR